MHAHHPWAKEIMTLIHFIKIISDFHPETTTSLHGDKYHQLRHIIHMFNDVAKKIFNLEPNAEFDEGSIAIRS